MVVYTSLNQIFKNGRRIVKDFTNCDLSHIDLSYIPPALWDNAVFCNTNFENTNIKFNPTNVYCYGNCNFTNCDLSYLSDSSFQKIMLYNTLKNINKKISSCNLLKTIRMYLCSIILPHSYENEKNIILKNIEESLEFDKNGIFKRFYYDISPYLTDINSKLLFFKTGKIKNVYFKKLDLSYLDATWLIKFCFEKCYFEELILSASSSEIEEAVKIRGCSYADIFIVDSNIDKLCMPINFHNERRKRLLISPISYQTSLYVNSQMVSKNISFYNNHQYSYENIVKNLKSMLMDLNNVFIVLDKKDLIKKDLLRLIKDLMIKKNEEFTRLDLFYVPSLTNWSVVTNGNLTVDECAYFNRFYNLYISRHAIDDRENSIILKEKNRIVLNYNQLEYLSKLCLVANNTLCCTCFKGSIDSKSKIIEYIKFAKDIGYKRIIFETLQQGEYFNNEDFIGIRSVEEKVFKEVLEHLGFLGFSISGPIYSSYDYEFMVAKMDSMEIYFKEYREPIEIAKKFTYSPKRCFDLLMMPNGNILKNYNNLDK